jgi:hypothetical protein
MPRPFRGWPILCVLCKGWALSQTTLIPICHDSGPNRSDNGAQVGSPATNSGESGCPTLGRLRVGPTPSFGILPFEPLQVLLVRPPGEFAGGLLCAVCNGCGLYLQPAEDKRTGLYLQPAVKRQRWVPFHITPRFETESFEPPAPFEYSSVTILFTYKIIMC